MQDISPQQAERLLDDLCAVVMRAGRAIMAVPPSDAQQRTKNDMSPVTAADEAAEAIILAGLSDLCPGVPVVAEESVAQGRIPAALDRSFFCVDPLDGTKEFLAGRDEFTVNLGVITQGQAIAGIIAAPAQGLMWRGVVGFGAARLTTSDASGAGNRWHTIHPRKAPRQLTVASSRTHLDDATTAFIDRLPVGARYQCGSSVKFCHVAEGRADIYPRLSPTSEWDIAAGCAIVAAAGGAVRQSDGSALRFGNRAGAFRVPGFVAAGEAEQLTGLNRP